MTGSASSPQTVRFGILGAARIAPKALIAPARKLPGVEVRALAARDPGRARAFAAEHGIPSIEESYEALLARPDLDAVYLPLPNALHAPWARAALEAGKHVLCEKPITANAGEARALFELAGDRGLLLMEAIHYPFHPVAAHIRSRCRGAEGQSTLGRLDVIEAVLTAPIPEHDIRFDLSLAGGATMDLGCYTLHVLRMAAGAEPVAVEAQARTGPPGIDVGMDAELCFASGVRGRMRVAMGAGTPYVSLFRAHGSRGELEVTRFQAPMLGHEIRAQSRDGRELRQSLTLRSTFAYQLEAFLAAVAGPDAAASPYGRAADAVANMTAIDAVYRAAQLPVRGSSRGPTMPSASA